MRKKLNYTPELDVLNAEEHTLLDRLCLSVREFVRKSPELSKVPYRTRDAHATTYAVLKGKFVVDEHFEERAVFPAASLDALLRISNANMKVVKGRAIPAYGFSLKLEHMGNTTANFPLVNFPLFPFDNVKTFLKLFISLNKFFCARMIGKIRNAAFLFFYILRTVPRMMHASFLKNIRLFIKRRNDFVLSWSYHSIGVYRLGNHLVKVKLVPDIIQSVEDPNYPEVSVAEYMIRHGRFTARVLVQYAYDTENQPVNNLHREWRNSPFVQIGTLDFTSVLRKNDPRQELLSFNPFENEESFQPVGRIQQLRKKAYEASYEARNGPF